jgi:hypothetical protein
VCLLADTVTDIAAPTCLRAAFVQDFASTTETVGGAALRTRGAVAAEGPSRAAVTAANLARRAGAPVGVMVAEARAAVLVLGTGVAEVFALRKSIAAPT